MRLVFVFGQVASGKLTIARKLAERTGFALFHNHLVVDTVAAVFPFGSPEFVRLREVLWLEMIGAAAAAGRSLVFTFAPEPTVAADFPARVAELVGKFGGEVDFVRLDIEPAEQLRRLDNADRGAFGKLRSIDLLRELKPAFDASLAIMPTAEVTIDTGRHNPDQSAAMICTELGLTG
jgi:hypothetical protein